MEGDPSRLCSCFRLVASGCGGDFLGTLPWVSSIVADHVNPFVTTLRWPLPAGKCDKTNNVWLLEHDNELSKHQSSFEMMRRDIRIRDVQLMNLPSDYYGLKPLLLERCHEGFRKAKVDPTFSEHGVVNTAWLVVKGRTRKAVKG